MTREEAAALLPLIQATPVGKDARVEARSDGQGEIRYCCSEDGSLFYVIRSQAEYEQKRKQGWLENQWLEALEGEKFSGAWWW